MSESKKPEIVFKYIFNYAYNPVYVNGAHGGLSPRGELVMNFYLERPPLPEEIVRKTGEKYMEALVKLTGKGK